MEYGPFWDDACLSGEIGSARSPPVTDSLFDSDLFCDEETLDAVVPEPAAPACAPAPSLPPPSGPEAWRTFMDDNCPFRRRVKVTIAPTRKRTARVALAAAVTGAPPARAPPRKRARCDSPAAQAVLHFPPQFAAPSVPGRVRVVAPPAASALADSLLLDGLACLEDSDLLVQPAPSVDTPISPEPLDDMLTNDPESPQSTKTEPKLLQVDLAGVSQAPDDSTSDSLCSDADGYMTSKLQTRLRDVLAPSLGDLDFITALSRASSTSRSFASTGLSVRACSLPRVDAALLAVTRAAAAYSAQLNLGRA